MKRLITLSLLMGILPCMSGISAQELHVVTTGDVHGAYFNRPYVGSKYKTSLMSVKYYVDSLRSAVGPENVLLLDAGDCIQGDNASYYFNYVATDRPHIYPRLVSYMGYDACTVGNHDIEAGHPVYDRVYEGMKEAGIPWLAGNALKEDGTPYFQEYTVIEKGGRRILVLGYNNANIEGWLSPELWSGMKYVSLVPFVRKRVKQIRKEVDPDVVVVIVHSGTGAGDGSSYESQGLDVFRKLKGVDVLVTAHDHRPAVVHSRKSCLVNGGARCGNVGHVVLGFNKGKVVSRHAEVVRLDKMAVDEGMVSKFDQEFEEVKAFTVRPVGNLAMPLMSRDAYIGMNDYVSLLHTVQLGASGADISIAAPLTYDGKVAKGQLVFNDMFTIYPYENQLFVLRLSGKEIKDMLEFSYDHWICTPGDHVLRISQTPDPRTGAAKWSFVNRSYNFDSAAGIVYDVDVTKPAGSRVIIRSLAGGKPFDENATYTVAMTSYRANGGGDLLTLGAGIPHEQLGSRVIARYPEIRDLVYAFIKSHDEVNPELIGNRSVIGEWKFVPEDLVNPLLAKDLRLVF